MVIGSSFFNMPELKRWQGHPVAPVILKTHAQTGDGRQLENV
jgi:hypothetical protein